MNTTVKRLSVLMATAFVDMIGFAMVFPLLPYYARRLEAADWTIGWMIAIFSIAQLAAAPLWGRLSDRWGRRGTIILGLTTSAIAYVVFGFATSMWWLFLSRLVQGFGGGTTGVLQAYVADVTAPKDRAKALGWLSAATGAGVMVGPAIGSLAFSLGPAAPGLFAAALCVCNIWFASRWLPESQAEEHRTGDRPRRSVGSMVIDIALSPRGELARLVWIYAVGMLGFMSMTAVLAFYLQDEFAITERTIGPFFVYVGAVSVIMRAVLLGRLIEWLGETKLMRAGAAILAVGLFALPFPNSVISLIAVLTLIPVGTACLFPATTALITHRTPEVVRGQMLGVTQAFGGGARVLAPVWAAATYDALGHDLPFYVSGLVVAVVMLLAFGVRHRRDAAEAQAAA